jgi:hypothetical protein
VHPKGKELSLVAKAFLDFAIEHGPSLRELMITMWPALQGIDWCNEAKDSASTAKKAKPKKKAAKKKAATRNG